MKYDAHSLGRPLVAVCCYNNGIGAKKTLRRLPVHGDFDVAVFDDGSTDDTPKYLSLYPFPVVREAKNKGVGHAIKTAIRFARDHQYQVLVVMAGNSKDKPDEIDRLLEPIYEEGIDYVQGSRRLNGGKSPKLPWFRQIMVPVHAWVFRVLTGFPCTDALNGFRAFKVGMFFNDSRLNVWQDWLDKYEFETYTHYKMLTEGFRVKEVPVTKSYAAFSRKMAYSHIRPFVDWWKIMRPLLYLKLGIKK